MADDELIVKVSLEDELSRQISATRKSISSLERDMAKARAEAEKTGDYSGLERLQKAYEEERRSLARLRVERMRASREVRKMASDTAAASAKMQSSWKRLRAVMANPLFTAATLAGITLFGKRAVEAFAQAETSQMKLVQAYSKFSALSDVPIDSIRQLAAELQSLTGTDDDLLAAAAATLARFELTGTAIEQLLPLVNDFAILTGRDVVDASEAVGKAFMGNARALKELGIDFKATGDRGKDLETIMAALEEKAGGTGEAFGQTAQGGLARASAAFNDLQETIGSTLVPVLNGMLKVVEPLVRAFQALPDPIQSVISVIGFLGAAAFAVGPRLAMIAQGMSAAGISAAGMGRKLALAAGKLAIFAAGVVALQKAMESTISSDFRGDTDALTKSFEDFGNTGQLSGEALRFMGEDFAYLEENLAYLLNPGFADSVNKAAWSVLAFLGVPTGEQAGLAAFAQLDSTLASMATTNLPAASAMFDEITRRASALGIPIEDLITLLPDTARELGLTGDAMGNAAGETGSFASRLDYMRAKISLAASGFQPAVRGASEMEQALAEAKTAADQLAGALDGVTGAVNRYTAMQNYKQALKDYIADPSNETAATAMTAFADVASSIEDPGERAEFTRGAIKKIEDVAQSEGLKLNPILQQGLDDAKAAADRVKSSIERIPDLKEITIRYIYEIKGSPPPEAGGATPETGGAGPDGSRANGGLITGPGGPTTDTAGLYALSNGEFVVRANAVKALGLDMLKALNHADYKMPAFIAPDMSGSPRLEPVAVPAGAPAIGEVHVHNPPNGTDVQAEVLWAMRRAERIRRERGA